MPDRLHLPLDWSLLGDAPLAIAVSGGADSFALLHAVAERGLPVTALTVDHGLRKGSAEDARAVAAWCAERDIPHETLAWTGDKPATGIQDAARTARYRLLCEACERLGLDRLATGHTLDDQAETVFMRLRRGAGRGLAGMPPSRRIASGPGEPVTLLRPLLGARRAEARAYAEAAGLPVRDDPSNEDEGFERVRVRALLGALEEQGLLTAEALGRTGRAVGRLTDEAFSGLVEEWSARAWLDRPFYQAGPDISLPFDEDKGRSGESDGAINLLLAHVGDEFGVPVLTQLVGAMGDRSLSEDEIVCLSRFESNLTVAGVQVVLHVLDVPENERVPVRRVRKFPDGGGATITPVYTEAEVVTLLREPAALLGRADGTSGLAPVPAQPGSRHLYDRRFVVRVPSDVPPGTELRPLGQLIPRDLATSTLARSRVATLPCLSQGDRVTHLPAAAIRAVRDAFAGWRRAGEVLPSSLGTFEARSLLAERFANDVIRY